MAATVPGGPEVELAHVLFVDLVGYSRLTTDRQTERLARLQGTIRAAAEVHRADAAGLLLCLPTGDGMALVFFGSPEAPLRCAMELARALRPSPEIALRMGVHTGPVYRIQDINAHQNVAGGGINMAQRVMDCGDAGHILLSRGTAELLLQLSTWEGCIHDLGECRVKHGVSLHLYNVVTEQAGNPARPSRLAGATAPPSSETEVSAPTSVPTPAAGPSAQANSQVAILYKRHAQPDGYVLQLLETAFRSRGFTVFIDRHLKVGVEWAREIEQQVRASDVVIPLLSAASVQSEMLAYEVQIAHDAAQAGEGKPRLLPVRIDYTGPLPEGLASILDPLQYALWGSPSDDTRLPAELMRALEEPAVEAETATAGAGTQAEAARGSEEAFGGAVPLGSPFYVERETDGQFLAAIARRESLVLVKGARQMGKTSLLARGLQRARDLGSRAVLTDFQKFTLGDLETPERFLRTLGDWVADQLDLDVYPGDVWRTERSPSINFERYVRREVLGKMSEPLAWGMDEVDRLFTYPYASDVFGLFRSWHNARATDPTQPWARLTLAICYATEAHLFITDANQSPFNVGVRLSLEDFSFEQVNELNGRYGEPLMAQSHVARFYRLLNGHPYLVRRGLHTLVNAGVDLATFEATADRDEGIYGDQLRRILVTLSRDAELLEVVRGLLRGQPLPSEETFYRLRSAGLVAGDSPRSARPRCQLYANYLERHIL
ncbi:MAG TPA: AAA-like domain-containing protein [Armatimonadota bacterium]|nr:AAA-like domain-containing protein [Armatimonadota bacterium]